MLTREENERLTRVGRGTPTGELLRRFWLPFLLTADLSEPDGAPVRVGLLGERLLAFRDTSGRIGLIDRACAHRCADLFFGRNEENGLRCTYHGWKYDVEGKCLDMPTEDVEKVLSKIISSSPHTRCASGREFCGPTWVPKSKFPSCRNLNGHEFPMGTDLFRGTSRKTTSFRRSTAASTPSIRYFSTAHWTPITGLINGRNRRKRDGDARLMHRVRTNPPKLVAKDTDYGVLIGGKYRGSDGTDYWRYNNFLMPFYTMPPGGGSGLSKKIAHAFVPIDDESCIRWVFTWNFAEPLSAKEIAEMRAGSSVHVEFIPGTHYPARNMSNDYLIDRESQKTLTFTGIKGIGEQDFSVQEGMGAVVDRTREHLGSSDIGIVAMRRRLLKAAADLQEGVAPYAALHGDVYRIRSAELVLPADAPWDENENLKAAMTATW